MIQVWIINILVMRSRGRTEKSKNGQKHHRTKAPKDQNQSGQNPQKWENILILKQSRCTIPWSHDTGVDNQHSRHAITCGQRKAKMDKSTTVRKPKKDQNQSGQTPQKWENILILQQSRCTIPWSHDTGGGQRKAKVDKSTTGRKPKKDQNQSGQNPQKWENILILQQSRCTNPWSPDTGVDNQHSRHAITWADREKQKWTKAPQDESQKRIRIKADKTPKKWENILILQQSRCTNPWSLDTGVDNQHSRHAITWADREKQKWTKAKQDENQKGSESKRTKPPKMRKYFNTPTIKVHDPMITWYRCG